MDVNMKTIHKNQLAEIINLTKKIAQEKIAPQASKFDQATAFPRDALHILGESDLPALCFLKARMVSEENELNLLLL